MTKLAKEKRLRVAEKLKSGWKRELTLPGRAAKRGQDLISNQSCPPHQHPPLLKEEGGNDHHSLTIIPFQKLHFYRTSEKSHFR